MEALRTSRGVTSSVSGRPLTITRTPLSVSAIRAVITNDMYLSSKITDKVVKDYARHLTESTPVLTAREREILQLITEGKNTKEIASILCVSVNTVATHRNNIMDKLNMCSTAELVKYAIRRGITSV